MTKRNLSQKSAPRKKPNAVAWAIKQNCPNSVAKLVLMVIADQSDAHGLSFMSQDTIAKRCQLSRKTVNVQIKALEEAKLIIRSERWFGGIRSSDHIQIQCPGRCNSPLHTPVTEGCTIPSSSYEVENDKWEGAWQGAALRVVGGTQA